MPPAELPPVFILAAGLGTRLGFSSAKALFPVAGRPLLEWILLECERQETRRVIVTILRQHEPALARFCAYRAPAGIQLSVSVDDAPAGTLGSLRKAWSRFPCDRFFVWLGDVVACPPLRGLEEILPGAPAALLAHQRTDYESSGVMNVAGARTLSGFREKPGYLGLPAARVWAGIAALEGRELEASPGQDLGRDLWPRLAASGLCRVLDMSPAGLLAAVDRREDADRLSARLKSAGTR